MKRTKNYSIRFDEVKLAFFKEKNPNVKMPQEIVDFFMDEFFIKNKLMPEAIENLKVEVASKKEQLEQIKSAEIVSVKKNTQVSKAASLPPANRYDQKALNEANNELANALEANTPIKQEKRELTFLEKRQMAKNGIK